ncbi:MAG: hypothetical protein KF729_35065 [Sandaracinaceae bacterium]|nr:hypothetical protein [Sandaracinaceae bacterium]
MRQALVLASCAVLLASPALARVVGWHEHPLVRAAIDATRASVGTCLDGEPATQRVVAVLHVRSDGRLERVSFPSDPPLGAAARYCVARTLAPLRLPPPRRDQHLRVTYARAP